MEENNAGSGNGYRAFSPSSSFDSLSDLDSAAPPAAVPFLRYPSFLARGRAAVGLGVPRSPRRRRFFLDDGGDDGAHHFLDSCHLCRKPLGGGRDIFMYRGDTPFCSEECRQEQIDMDEAQEKRAKMAQKQQHQQKAKNSKSPSKSEQIHVRVTGTVVAG